MAVSAANLMATVAAQASVNPIMYARVDFGVVPERFIDTAPHSNGKIVEPWRAAILADHDLVARLRAYTLLGDPAADAYAALIPHYGFRGLISMLGEACDRGVGAGAPPELAALIGAMEPPPVWCDMARVERGARLERNRTAHAMRFAMRSAFSFTFTNKYAALPLALTGTLSSDMARRRILETATFFATTTLPGALRRHGPGFRAAAMVRLMHAMVRYRALRDGQAWDVGVFGVPIPQIDQMPAGLIPNFPIAQRLVAKGRSTYSDDDRDRLELGRYRCFLLGLPDELMPDTPQAMVHLLAARQATLRPGYDHATCGALLRATMAADLATGRGVWSRLLNRAERGFSKVFFLKAVLRGDVTKAARIGIRPDRLDHGFAIAVGLLMLVPTVVYGLALRVPRLREAADRRLVRKLTDLIARNGPVGFVAEVHRPPPGPGGPATPELKRPFRGASG